MYDSNESPSPEFQTIESRERKSSTKRGIAVLCALAVTAAITIGYVYLVRRHADRLRAETASQEQLPRPAPSPQVQVFVDDAMIKGSEAVLGGTVLNISPDTLTGVTVELELKRRRDGVAEFRTVSVVPSDLATNQQGRYALNVSSRDYRETRVLRIKSTRNPGDVPFRILPGAQRPIERLPTKETIVVKPPSRRGKGEEFINTPDNPVSLP